MTDGATRRRKTAAKKRPAKKTATKRRRQRKPPHDNTVTELCDVATACGRKDLAKVIEAARAELGKKSAIVDIAIHLAYALLHDPEEIESSEIALRELIGGRK